MKVKALFNKKRQREIKEALKRGDASVFRRGRPATPEQDQTATTALTPETGRARDELEMLIDLQLIRAAREGDLEGVEDAIIKGADVNTPHPVTLNPRPNLEKRQEYIEMTPLEAAEEGGNPEIIELLKKRGATK